MTLGAYIGLIGVHFLAYVFCLRKFAPFRKERGIFLYHLSFAAVGVTVMAIGLAAGLWAPDNPGVILISIVATHGIYSVSFLELWALADDSYSLAILRHLEASGGWIDQDLRLTLRSVGARKKADRLETLLRLGLVEMSGDACTLTGAGRRVALVARLFLALTNVRRVG